jgi:Domain of unknown function (DUF6458)
VPRRGCGPPASTSSVRISEGFSESGSAMSVMATASSATARSCHAHRGGDQGTPSLRGVTRAWKLSGVTVGASLFCIAVGAILKFAVTAEVAGIDLQTVGVILMVIGVIGLVLGLFLMFARRRDAGPPGSGPYA